MSSPNQRDDFRLTYPEGERPKAVLDIGIFPVIEMSSTGLRLKFTGDVELFTSLTSSIKIILKFDEKFPNPRIECEGTYFRHTSDYVVIRLSKQVPATKLNAEQIRLKNKYPDIKF